jgi:hypothetical protein
MAKPMRSQLNQIRDWVRQGRTDAWIAHQLDVSASELREFRRRHELAPEGDGGEELDLRDEIEAEIEATLGEEEDEEPEDDEDLADEEEPDTEESSIEDGATDEDGGEPERRPRRRGRRGGRGGRGGGRRKAGALQGSFDHGEKDGYGLWLDPAVADDPTYKDKWAGHRAVEVEIEADQITIRRS